MRGETIDSYLQIYSGTYGIHGRGSLGRGEGDNPKTRVCS